MRGLKKNNVKRGQTDRQTDNATLWKNWPKSQFFWRKKKYIYVALNTWHMTPGTWFLTCDTWPVICDMWHMVGREHSLKMSAPQLARAGAVHYWLCGPRQGGLECPFADGPARIEGGHEGGIQSLWKNCSYMITKLKLKLINQSFKNIIKAHL